MVSYADLGGLGAREGIPVVHTWEPPPPPPPWIVAAASAGVRILATMLMLLPLFLFRPNRSSKAWWIWLPVVIAVLVGVAILSEMIGEGRDLQQAVCSFTVGLAAVWLLMPYLKGRHRIVRFFKTVPVLMGFSLLAFIPTLLADREGWLDFRSYLAGLLAFVSLATALALALSGLAVRRRFGRIQFTLWLAVWVVLAGTAIATPFAIFGSLGGNPEWGQFVGAILLISGITLALLLPLVLLSFFQPFYRARFVDWLKLPQPDATAGVAIPPKLLGVDPSDRTTTAAVTKN